ncbi:Hypothetical protein KVN_LOCUS168 [uncultured virus]|nr:Hypothetical protein KVN_LOCUS168 [uncultured virus]
MESQKRMSRSKNDLAKAVQHRNSELNKTAQYRIINNTGQPLTIQVRGISGLKVLENVEDNRNKKGFKAGNFVNFDPQGYLSAAKFEAGNLKNLPRKIIGDPLFKLEFKIDSEKKNGKDFFSQEFTLIYDSKEDIWKPWFAPGTAKKLYIVIHIQNSEILMHKKNGETKKHLLSNIEFSFLEHMLKKTNQELDSNSDEGSVALLSDEEEETD